MGAAIFLALSIIFFIWAAKRVDIVTIVPSQAQPCLPWVLLLGVLVLAFALITFGE